MVSRDIVQKLLCHNTEIPVVTFKGIRTSGLLTGKDLKTAVKSQRSCFPGQQGITPLWTLCVVAPEHQGNIGGREGILGSAVLSHWQWLEPPEKGLLSSRGQEVTRARAGQCSSQGGRGVRGRFRGGGDLLSLGPLSGGWKMRLACLWEEQHV